MPDIEFALTPYEDVVEDDPEEKTEFTFDELDNAAKNKARDKWREHDMQDDWWEFVYDDAVAVGKLIGIEIGSTSRAGYKGKTYIDPDISFSGFSCQGDGCCYSGDLLISQLKGCVAAVKTHVGNDERMFALAAEGEALYEMILLRLVTLRMQMGSGGEGEESEIDLNARVSIEGSGRCYRTATTHSYIVHPDIAHAMDAYVSSFADWIYEQLEQQHDYLTSDECVDEAIKANDCLFDEYGSTI